jgi:hypothetical protein
MILFGSEVTVSVTAPLRSHSLANVSFEGQGSRGLRVFCLTFSATVTCSVGGRDYTLLSMSTAECPWWKKYLQQVS